MRWSRTARGHYTSEGGRWEIRPSRTRRGAFVLFDGTRPDWVRHVEGIRHAQMIAQHEQAAERRRQGAAG